MDLPKIFFWMVFAIPKNEARAGVRPIFCLKNRLMPINLIAQMFSNFYLCLKVESLFGSLFPKCFVYLIFHPNTVKPRRRTVHKYDGNKL